MRRELADTTVVLEMVERYLWKRRINLKSRGLIAGPCRYDSIHCGRVINSDANVDDALGLFMKEKIEFHLPVRAIKQLGISPYCIQDEKELKLYTRGKLLGSDKITAFCKPSDRFIFLPRATTIGGFIVIRAKPMEEGKITVCTLETFKEVVIDEEDSYKNY